MLRSVIEKADSMKNMDNISREMKTPRDIKKSYNMKA